LKRSRVMMSRTTADHTFARKNILLTQVRKCWSSASLPVCCCSCWPAVALVAGVLALNSSLAPVLPCPVPLIIISSASCISSGVSLPSASSLPSAMSPSSRASISFFSSLSESSSSIPSSPISLEVSIWLPPLQSASSVV